MSWIEHPRESSRYNLTALGIDQAWLNITNLSKDALWLYELSADCLECAFTKSKYEYEDIIAEGESSVAVKVSTSFHKTFRLQKDGKDEILSLGETQNRFCQVETEMGEFGAYELTAASGENSCTFETVVKPVNIYFPMLIAFFFYLGLTIVIFICQKYKHKLPFRKDSKDQLAPSRISESGSSKQQPAPPPPRQRIRSLDTLRGISIVIMIFVNDGAASYAYLEHATWDGLYVADLVFPWFLWIMGVCIPVSIKSQVKRNTPALTIIKRISIRSFKLIGIGLILNTYGGPILLTNLRIFGVLQRFGICYFVVANLVLFCSSKDFVNNTKANNKYVAAAQDIFFIWKGWVVVIAIVILHTCLTFCLPVPGCPTGYLGPGGLHKDNAYGGDCIGGAAGYIDRKILTLAHIYQWPTTIGTYKSGVYDPEGILGTLTSILTVWLGVQAGLTLQVYRKDRSRLVRWAIWAVLTGAIGAALCGGKQTGGAIPLNKNLWSLSFVFVLGSLALILLIVLYVTIDLLKIWSGTPFFEPGMNSIFLYVGHSIASGMVPFHFRWTIMNTHWKRLVEALWGTSMWVLWSIYLFHKKFFWSL